MKSQTIKEDILPILVILFTALLFSFKISFSANTAPAPTTFMNKALSPVLPAVASFEDAVEATTVSMENALRTLVPSIPSEASFDETTSDNINDSLISKLAPVMPTEADFE